MRKLTRDGLPIVQQAHLGSLDQALTAARDPLYFMKKDLLLAEMHEPERLWLATNVGQNYSTYYDLAAKTVYELLRLANGQPLPGITPADFVHHRAPVSTESADTLQRIGLKEENPLLIEIVERSYAAVQKKHPNEPKGVVGAAQGYMDGAAGMYLTLANASQREGTK